MGAGTTRSPAQRLTPALAPSGLWPWTQNTQSWCCWKHSRPESDVGKVPTDGHLCYHSGQD